mmetsp:Transcript_43087/g.104281  ORF Transcript_43087/g.104281 Transcript_43087/m.104281 type:complete len:591 (-) Transcript_43087:466-2238(-)
MPKRIKCITLILLITSVVCLIFSREHERVYHYHGQNKANRTMNYKKIPSKDTIPKELLESGSSVQVPIQNIHDYSVDLWESLWELYVPNDLSEHQKVSEERDVLLPVRSLADSFRPTPLPESVIWKSMFDAFPYPKDNNAVSIYNKVSYARLISKLMQNRIDCRKVTIVANGGSTTAGGGPQPIPQNERYYSLLAQFLNFLRSKIRPQGECNETVEVFGLGHGTRNSLHSAMLFDSFIPSDADLILWEFSINDAAELNEDLVMRNAKLNFLPWIHEVSKMKQPPAVILIYYWDSPYHRDNTTMSIVGRSFRAHGDIARQFDFVIGHINMAIYIDGLGLSACWSNAECPFLNDVHHASSLGHLATAFLLLNCMSPLGRLDEKKSPTFLTSIDYEWSCGVETPEKRILKKVITSSPTGWRSPSGGWTLDLPILGQLTPRRLLSGRGVKQIERFGRQRPMRQDTQRCTPLSYCGADAADSFSVVATIKPLTDIRVMLLSFKHNGPLIESTMINVKLNQSNVSAVGKLVPMRVEKAPAIVEKWPCHLSNANTWGTRSDVYWFIFEAPQPIVSSIEICQPPSVKNTAKVQTILLW